MSNNESYLLYLSNTFTSPSLQKCHLATKAQAIGLSQKVGGRKAPPNANFSTFATSRARTGPYPRQKREEKRLFYFSRMHRHEPRSTILKQARLNTREKVFS